LSVVSIEGREGKKDLKRTGRASGEAKRTGAGEGIRNERKRSGRFD